MPKTSPNDSQVINYHDYVDEQIRRTSRAVKVSDVSLAVLRLVVMVLLLLVAAAVAEHWVFRGGFSGGVRYALFVGLLGAVGWWGWKELWPLVSRAINPVFAAQTIEQASPSLKNSLVNLLLFRSQERAMPSAVYDALQRQAAERLAGVAGEEPVDRRGLIRLGYVLVGLLAIGAMYALLSPKNPFLTAARVLMPWAEIAAPTRVQITEVEPGTTEATRGAEIPVAAQITGLTPEEQPELVVLSDQGRGEDHRIPLSTPSGSLTTAEDATNLGGGRFSVSWLPAEEGTFGDAVDDDRPLRWRIEAGDAHSPTYKLTLRTAPAIVVRSVHYDYPDYTGYFDRTSEGVGDMRAIEGTKVTVIAQANTPIDAAQVDFAGDGRPDVRMQSDGRTAQASWTLALREDRRTPRHPSYVLRYTTVDGRTNADPASYQIEVLPDIPPEASITAPEQPTRDVRLNETLVIRVEARDPDFGLDSVELLGESLGSAVFDAPLLQAPQKDRFAGQWRFTPTDHGLREGDIVDYWVAARDIRRPESHETKSPRQRLRIVAAKPGEPNPEEGLAERNQDGGQADQQPGRQEQGQPDGGEGQPGGQGAGEQGMEQGAGEAGDQEGGAEEGQTKQGGEEGGAEKSPDGQRQEGPAGGAPSNDASGANEQQRDETEGDSPAGDQAGEPDRDNQANRESDGSSQDGHNDGADDGQQNRQRESNERGGGQPSANDSSNSAEENRPVSAEGDDDATAFDRIRKHLEEQQKRQESGNESNEGAGSQAQGAGDESPPSPSPNSSGDARPQDGEDQKPDDANQGANEQEGANRSPSQNGEGADPSEGSKPAAGEQPERNGGQPDGGDPQNNDRARKPSDSISSDGGHEVGEEDAAEANEKPRQGTGGQGKSEAADEGAGTSGDRGAGESTPEGGDKEPSAEQQGDPSAGERPGDGQSRREGQGDKPGGEQGGQTQGGQESNPEQQPGDQRDEAGRDQASGDAASDAQDRQGQEQAGNERRDGQRDGQTGDGQQRDGQQESGQQENQQSGQEQVEQGRDGQPGEQTGPAPPQAGDQAAGDEPRGGAGAPTGKGQEGAPRGDEANLEYARKKTDLLLESLEEQLQRKQVDQDLLESLGWSEEDLRKFVARWQSRKRAAQERGPGAEAELDEALRQLGLRPDKLTAARPRVEDTQRDNRTGFQGTVPAQYRERLRRYSEGVSRGAER